MLANTLQKTLFKTDKTKSCSLKTLFPSTKTKIQCGYGAHYSAITVYTIGYLRYIP